MAGLAFGSLLGLVALFFLGKGMLWRRWERRLLARLLPVSARVLDQGDRPGWTISVSTDDAGHRTERPDYFWEGRYEYEVDGQVHTATATSTAGSVFRRDQMPPNRVTVFYDPRQPAVSRISKRASDGNAAANILFGWVVLVVAVFVVLIPNLDRLITPSQTGGYHSGGTLQDR